MPREPNPMAGCLPGGHCPVCNPREHFLCHHCEEVEVSAEGEPCADCLSAMEEDAHEAEKELRRADRFDEMPWDDFGSEV